MTWRQRSAAVSSKPYKEPSELQKLQHEYFMQLGQLSSMLAVLPRLCNSYRFHGDFYRYNCMSAHSWVEGAIKELKRSFQKERQRILDERAASKQILERLSVVKPQQ